MLAAIYPVLDTTVFPHSAAVQLQPAWDTNGNDSFDKQDYFTTCSGAMISSFQVLTAAHCLFNQSRGGYADWIFAHPGRDGAYDRPFGEAQGAEWVVPNSYQQGSRGAEFDLGVIALDRHIGNFTGWFGIAAIETHDPLYRDDPYVVDLLHYPGESNYDGKTQYAGSTLLSAQSQRAFPYYSVGMSSLWTTGGSSGSGLFTSEGSMDHSIIGVLSKGDRVDPGDRGTDLYTRIDQAKLGWITSRMAEQPRPTDRPVLVDHDRWFNTIDSTVSRSVPYVGETVRVQAKIFNAGTSEARNVTVRFRASQDDDYDETDLRLGDAVIPVIPPLQSRVASYEFTMPSRSAGKWHIVWTTDPENTIVEHNAPFQDVRVACHFDSGSSTCEAGHRRHGAVEIELKDDAYEQNDSQAAVKSLAAATWLSTLQGRGAQYDDDWFRIDVAADKRRIKADLRFTHAHGDIDLALYDSAGEMLAHAIGVQDNELLEYLVPSSGTYYLKVYHGNKGNTYDLRWDAVTPPDLLASSFNVGYSGATAGTEVPITYRIRNPGGAAGPFQVAVYLSRDAQITAEDRQLRVFTIDSLAANTTTALTSTTVRLPSPGDAYWNGDGQYHLGMIVDWRDDVVESDESNNANQALGTDVDDLQVTVHPYGTFQVIGNLEAGRIVLPRFDTSMGELERVAVSVVVPQVVTGPGGDVNCSVCASPLHSISFSVGPFAFSGAALPLAPFLIPDHTHLTIVGGGREFTGPELAAFRQGTQAWNMPANVRTSTDANHSHAITGLSFQATTTFYFDPPDPDLRATQFAILDHGAAFVGGEEIRLQYTVENAGPGVSLPFKVGFYVSEDPTITTQDASIGSVRFENGLAAGQTEQRSYQSRLPHPGTNGWRGDKRYYVGLIIDPDLAVEETNESNNSNRGVGLDQAAIDVTVHAPGTFSVLSSDTNEIALPAFDSQMGTLERVEVSVQFVQGFTDAGGPTPGPGIPPVVHLHTVGFDVDRFHFEGIAIPLPSPAPHTVISTTIAAKQEFTGAALQPFLADEQRLALSNARTAESYGHSHTLIAATFSTATTFYFERRPDFVGEAFELVSPGVEPGGILDVRFRVGNRGLAAAGSSRVELRLSRDQAIGEDDYTLGTVLLSELAAGTDSGWVAFTASLPFADDPFWSGSGDYWLGMVVDRDGEHREGDESNNANRGESLDRRRLPIALPTPAPPVMLGQASFRTLDNLNPAAGDLWYHVQAVRTGPLVAWAESGQVGNVRLSLYSVPAAEGEHSPGHDAPLARAVSSNGQTGITYSATAGETLLVRLSGDAPDVRLAISNLLERQSGATVLHGTAADDHFVMGAGAGNTITVNGVEFDLDREGITQLRLQGNGGADRYDLQASPTTSFVLDAGRLTQVDIDALGATVQRVGNEIRIPNRQPLTVTGADRLRVLNAANWQNPITAEDVNNDGLITPMDVLIAINELNAKGSRQLPEITDLVELPLRHFDVNNDGALSPLDVLSVINSLNSQSIAEGEPQAIVIVASADAQTPITAVWPYMVAPVPFGQSASESVVQGLETNLEVDSVPLPPDIRSDRRPRSLWYPQSR